VLRETKQQKRERALEKRGRATEKEREHLQRREREERAYWSQWFETHASVSTERLFRLFYQKQKGKTINSKIEYFLL
jgi:hypothetical protein